MYRVVLNLGGEVNFTLPQQHNTAFLVTSGAVTVNGNTLANEKELVLFGHSGEEITVKAQENSEFVVLDGEPINEAVVQYGPYVMNTPAEINQAIADFNNGRFGYLKD
jgi:redox-sensitive bicupin YhaK (pirin superfamily)